MELAEKEARTGTSRMLAFIVPVKDPDRAKLGSFDPQLFDRDLVRGVYDSGEGPPSDGLMVYVWAEEFLPGEWTLSLGGSYWTESWYLPGKYATDTAALCAGVEYLNSAKDWDDVVRAYRAGKEAAWMGGKLPL